MRKILLLLSIISLSWLLPSTASASHVAGGEITYQHLGNDSFLVSLTLYQDCGGSAQVGNFMNITVSSSCTGIQNMTVNLQNLGGTEVSQICAAQIGNSTCNGGTLQGMEEYRYTGIIQLTTHCSDYSFSFNTFARNTATNLVGGVNNNGFFISATLNSSLYPNNSSPEYTADPIPYVCVNQTVNYNYGVVENDGDSLSYALVIARENGGNLNYPVGYSATVPIPGITINSSTGELNFTPSLTGRFVIVTQVTEYNGAGQVISTVERDIQFVVLNCTNTIPTAPNSTTNLVNTVGSASVTAPLEITANVGDQFCFDVTFTDVNAGTTLSVTSNASTALPGSIVTFSGANPATATVCWTVPPGMNTNNTVTFQVNDNACPISGANSVAVTVIIPPPSSLTGVLTTTGISCNGICDATASVVASGGVGPYSYAWSPVGVWCCQGLPNITGLCAGFYSLSVRDLGDPDPSTPAWNTLFIIDDKFPISASITNIVNDDCTANCVGGVSVDVNPLSGTPPLSYLWNSGQTATTITSVCAGTYNLTITDANNCTKTISAIVQAPIPPTILIDSTDSVSCFGGNDGAVYARVHPTCGVSTDACAAPTSIELGAGAATNLFTTYPAPYGNSNSGARHQMLFTAAELTAAGVLPGTISSFAMDIAGLGTTVNYANFTIKMGCTSVSDLTGGWEAGLIEVFTPRTHVASVGWNTHNFDVKYFWDGLSNIVVEICFNNPNSTASGNALTRFTPTVNQSVRYYSDNTMNVCSSNNLTATSANRPNVRFGNCASTFTWAWSPAPAAGQLTPTVTSLTAQTYNVTVTSVGDGCEVSTTATVGQPAILVPTITLTNAISCAGVCDASISVGSVGGHGPYTYAWDNGLPTGSTQNNLCAGTYTVTVTDAKLCTATGSITITEPLAITATTSINSVISCFGVCDGDVTINGSGGTAPLTYAWPGGLVGAHQTNLCSGPYNITITDASGCFIVHNIILIEPNILSVSLATVGTILCNGDNTVTINSTVQGGTVNYTYLWNTGANSANLTNVGAGTYILTVTDAHNCTAIDQVIITEPTPLVGAIAQTAFIQCNGDLTASLTASAAGGTLGYTYVWSNGPVTPINANIGAGNYTVTVTDANGCTDVQNITVTEPDPVLANLTIDAPISCNGVCDGQVTVAPSGGTGPYTVVWQAGMVAAGNTATGLCGATAYSVTITDANACQIVEAINLTEPTLLTVSITIDQVISCGGVCDGILSATPAGGTAGYTYLWSTGAITPTINNLCVGVYTVDIIDAHNCTATQIMMLSEPNVLVGAIAQVGSILCNGDNTVTLTASANGGTINYTYLWNNGTATAINANIGAGTHIVTITDANNCTDVVTQVVTEPQPLVLTGVVNTQVSCNGVCDGDATVTANGGVGPYVYSWPGGLVGGNQNALCGGTYIVTVTDANSCTQTTTVVIVEPAAIVMTQIVNSNASCNGVCDGDATVTTVGGSAPIVITWPGGLVGGHQTALCAGTYTVTATDANLCTNTISVTISEPVLMSVTLAQVGTILCNGDNTVTINSTVLGGSPGYTYLWNTGAISDNLTNVGAGTYNVTVTDANLCTATNNIIVSEPTVLDVTISQTAFISCGGAPTAALLATGSGGTLGYTFLWSNGANTPAVTNLPAGPYTVTITDANGCTDTDNFTITQPTPIVPNQTLVNGISCNGVCDGSVTYLPTGGIAPYTIAWPAGVTNANDTATALCASTTYTVTVTDANGCTMTDDINLTEPTVVSGTINLDQGISCNGVCDAQVTATGAGGTGPYTYMWSNGTPGATTNNLCAGIYTVTITDANLCTGTQNITISEPVLMSVTLAQVGTILCNGDNTVTINSTVLGGSPGYTYLWNTGAISDNLTNVGAGTYIVTVTDANLCTATNNIIVSEPTVLDVTISQTAFISCGGAPTAALLATGSGGTLGYTFAWSNGGNALSITNLPAGAYNVTITDANGCTDTDVFTITQPTPIVPNQTLVNGISCNGVCDGSVTYLPTGGIAPYTIAWPAGVTNANDTATALCASTTYTVTIIDANGCTMTDDINLTEPTAVSVTINLDQGISCGGICDAQVTATGSGGTGPYTYMWSNGIAGATINNLCAGTFTVTVTDANLCTVSQSITITQPSPVVTTIVETGAILCFGDLTATLTATTIGGTGPFTYLWNTGDITPVIANVGVGVYSLTTTDANGCSVVNNYTILGPDKIVLTANITPMSCGGVCDGAATIIAVGGTPGMTFTWPGGLVGPTQNNLCAGNYIVTVTDAHACSDTITVRIVNPSTIVIITNVVSHISCNGVCDGEAQITLTGGTAPLTIAWPSGGNLNNEVALCAGSHTVTVTDANGCSSTATVVINDAPVINFTLLETSPITCNGVCDGVVTASVSGGTGPYSVIWPGNDTTNVKTGLCAGTYTVTIVDANSCSTTQTITITEPVILAATIAITTPISCNAVCDGVLTATVNGGTAPYTVTWSDGTVGMIANNLCAGVYTLNVVDANGCSATATMTITEPSAITTNLDVRDALCGICNGRIRALGTSGGDGGPYTYAWSSGFQLPPFPNTVILLCAGSYTVTITDNSGCSVVLSANVSNIGGATTPVFIEVQPSCNGGNNGSLTITASGGALPYTYAWSSGGSAATEIGLTAGIYTVTVTDTNGCELVASHTLGEPNEILNTETLANLNCNAVCDGSISLATTGGTGPYTYSWSNGMNGNAVTSLCAGTFTVTTTDANTCTRVDTYVISEPTAISTTIAITNPISCNGICDGEMTVSVSGGTAPYTMSWSNGGVGNVTVGLCAGSYDVTVTDANGCTSTATMAITEPTLITSNVATVNATCGACDGSITLSGTAGGAGVPYTFAWSNGESTSTINNLCAGTYTVTITDANGCNTIISTPINNVGGPTTAPIALTNPSCNGVCDGTMIVSPTGGTIPYTYAWSTGGATNTETALCAGIYFVTVTDANGCVFIGTDTIVEPTLIMNTDVITNASCNGICDGTITLTTTGGSSPYTYLWSNGNTGNSVTALCAATYSVTTTDANGCSTINSYTITEPSSINIGITIDTPISCNGICDGVLTAAALGGTSPYTFAWSNGGGAATITSLCAGSYDVTVTDANGCTNSLTMNISEPAAITATLTPTMATCGICDGELTITNMAGGDGGPYTFVWSNAAITPTITGLCPATYTVTITDGSGCTVVLSAPVSNNGGPTAASFVSVNPSCNGICDGTSMVTPVGGNAPYLFAWSSGGATDTETGLCAGIYTVTITDGSGCVFIASDTLTEPTPILNRETIVDATCNGICDGSITLTTAGGTGPYTYVWSNASTGPSVSALCVGSYTVTTTDASGCFVINTYLVSEPNPMTLTATTVDANCFNICDGSATASVAGGTAPYIYVWSNGTVGTTATGLCSSTSYDVTVTDAGGCTATTRVTISGPPAIVIDTIAIVDAACGMANGSANATASGGTGALTYTWNGVAGNPLSNVAAGIYVLVVTDANGCSITVNVPINNDVGPAISVTGTDLTCFGDNSGTATVTVTGTNTYAYLWNTGSTNATITGLSGGSYYVQVTDDTTGCISTDTITIGEPTQITIDNVVTQSPTCGTANGSAMAFASGGTGALTYNWNGSIVNPLINVGAGTHTLIVTDASGCTATTVVPLSDSGQFVATATGTDLLCFGDANGTGMVTVNPAGNYNYQWTSAPGDIMPNVTGLSAGSYGVSVTDPNTGCTASDTITINQPTQISIDNVNKVNPNCGAADGSLEAFVSGGTPGYTYVWNGTINGNPILSIPAGSYALQVTDINGCVATTTIPLSDIGNLTVAFTTTDVPCDGSCIGSAVATASGGTGPFNYSWSNGDNIQMATALCAGLVTVTVTDAVGGCSAVDTVSINQMPGLTMTMNSTDNTNCGGTCDGTAEAVVSGSTGTITYAWSNGGSTATITSLCAGTYAVTATDASGCSAIDSVTIIDGPAMTMTVDTVLDATCLNTNDGEVQITVTGGVPTITYSWTGPNGFTSSNQNISFLFAGTYKVSVTDQNGCEITDTAVVKAKSDLAVSLADQIICTNSDSVTLTPVVTGTTNTITYQWYNLGGAVIGNDSTLTTVMPNDTTYYVIGVVSGGCSATDTAFVAPGQIPDVDAGLTQTIVIGQEVKLGGSPTTTWGGSTFEWTPDQSLSSASISNPIATPTETRLYQVKVTNILGCTNTDTVRIIVTKKLKVISGFTPNGDGTNDTWVLDFLEKYPSAEVKVYNRWGELLYQSDDGYKIPWDGKYEGQDIPVGTYYYVIDLKDGDFPDPLTGPVTIIR